ncbi:MAG: hypothetical protein OEY79_02910 [Anaplasmataceae bacterium]|nr:hypothetical protein [Anaplasmataceae bacterium]
MCPDTIAQDASVTNPQIESIVNRHDFWSCCKLTDEEKNKFKKMIIEEANKLTREPTKEDKLKFIEDIKSEYSTLLERKYSDDSLDGICNCIYLTNLCNEIAAASHSHDHTTPPNCRIM